MNIASIVDTAQVVDQMLSRQLKGGAIALSLSRERVVGDDVNDISNDDYGNSISMAKNHDLSTTTTTTNTNTLQSLINWTLVRWNRSACYLDDDDIIEGSSNDVDIGGDNVDYDNCVPFQTSTTSSQTSWLVTLGYLLAAICFLPMSLQDLKVRH